MGAVVRGQGVIADPSQVVCGGRGYL
jgi:hypothetical protein